MQPSYLKCFLNPDNSQVRWLHFVSFLLDLADVGVSLCRKKKFVHLALFITGISNANNSKWRRGKKHANVCLTMENQQYAKTCSYDGMVVIAYLKFSLF